MMPRDSIWLRFGQIAETSARVDRTAETPVEMGCLSCNPFPCDPYRLRIISGTTVHIGYEQE